MVLPLPRIASSPCSPWSRGRSAEWGKRRIRGEKMKAGKRRKAACPLKIQCRKTVRKETKTNLNLQRRNQTLVSSVSEEEGEMQWQRKGNRERRKRRGRGDRESGKQRLLASLSLSRSPNQLFSASDFTFSFLFHVDPLPPPRFHFPEPQRFPTSFDNPQLCSLP